MRTAPNTFGAFAVLARARSIVVTFRAYVHTVYICLLTIVFRARAQQARIVFRYTQCERARCIELLLFYYQCCNKY